MKRLISAVMAMVMIVCSMAVVAAPKNNFEYIDYPGTKYIYGAEHGFVFHMLDGRKIYLDEYGNETDDIVGVMGQNVFYDDNSEAIYLYDNNNKLIDKFVAEDYEFAERDDYIAVSKLTDPTDARTFTVYSKIDGTKLAELSAKDYIIGNTYSGAPEFELNYWGVTKSGNFWFSDPNGVCGISDIRGNIIVEPKYKQLELCDYERELFKVKTDQGVAILDKEGNIIKEIEADTVGKVVDRPDDVIQYYASDDNGANIPLDMDFNKIPGFDDERYSFMWSLNNSHFVVQYADAYQRPKTVMGIMNLNGEIIVPIEYQYIEGIGHGYVAAYKSGDSGRLTLIRYNMGGYIVEEDCNYITEVGDNGYIGISKEGFEGYIDQHYTRAITLPAGWFVQGAFKEGKAAVVDDYNAPFGRSGGSTVYINEAGKVIVDDPNQEWYKGTSFKNNLASVANNLKKNGAYGWLLIKYTGDMPSDWAEASVKAAIDNDLLPIGAPDYLDSQYRENITREEFCNIAARIVRAVADGEGLDTTPSGFTDTDNTAIYGLYNAGIIEGKSKTQFAPKDLITREEAAKILNAMYTYLRIEQPQKDEEYIFSDHDEISKWARLGVYNMNAAGIMVGTGNDRFSPKDNYTREQAIVTLMRIYDASQTGRTVMFETDTTVDKEKNISSFKANIYQKDNGGFDILGENLEYLDYIHITTSKEKGLMFGFSLYQRVMFQTEELSKIMWEISNIQYDGEVLLESAEEANKRIKILLNGEPAQIQKITQGKGSGHTDFYLHLDKIMRIKDIKTLDIICQ